VVALSKRRSNPGTWLRERAHEAGRHEDADGTVDVGRTDEDVEIDERPQRRLRVVQMRDGAAFQDPGLDAGRGQQVDDGDQLPLERQHAQHDRSVRGSGLVGLRLGCGQGTLIHYCPQEAGQPMRARL